MKLTEKTMRLEITSEKQGRCMDGAHGGHGHCGGVTCSEGLQDWFFRHRKASFGHRKAVTGVIGPGIRNTSGSKKVAMFRQALHNVRQDQV